METYDFTPVNGFDSVYYFFKYKDKLYCTQISCGEVKTWVTEEAHKKSVALNYQYYKEQGRL